MAIHAQTRPWGRGDIAHAHSPTRIIRAPLACKMGEQAVQVAFMLDTRSTTSNVLLRHRSLCLACTRVLFYLSGFPNRAQQKCVQWKYVFFNERESAKVKVPHFVEVNLSCIENMFKELHLELRSNALETQVSQMTLPVLRSAIVDVVQRTVWDSPDILSPPKTRARKPGTRKGGRWKSTLESEPMNAVIVCSQWPGQLDQLTGNLFPSDLKSFLLKKNVSVFWLHEGDPTCNDEVSLGNINHYCVCIIFIYTCMFCLASIIGLT